MLHSCHAILIILAKLTIFIPIGIEMDDDSSEEDLNHDTNPVPRIPLVPTSYSDLEWQRLVNVLLRTGMSESPIARHILFDFRYPAGPLPVLYFNLISEDVKDHRSNCESALVKRRFSKLSRKSDLFEELCLESSGCMCQLEDSIDTTSSIYNWYVCK